MTPLSGELKYLKRYARQGLNPAKPSTRSRPLFYRREVARYRREVAH